MYMECYFTLSPTGPYICDHNGNVLSLLVISDQICAWPGSTSVSKLGLNYAVGFPAQRFARLPEDALGAPRDGRSTSSRHECISRA